jgi:hypothetical protein
MLNVVQVLEHYPRVIQGSLSGELQASPQAATDRPAFRLRDHSPAVRLQLMRRIEQLRRDKGTGT